MLVVTLTALTVVKLATGTSHAVEFCNNIQIATPLSATPGTANPYPSSITVSGLTGTITDVNVTLLSMNTQGDTSNPPQHWAEDNDVMVSSPSGTGVILMSDAGGDNDNSVGPVANVTLLFDEQAANQLPADSHLSGGASNITVTARPVNDSDPNTGDGPDEWDAPAPAPGGTALSAFNGQNPNGTWRLWITDDVQGATATFAGWCVDILTTGGGTSTSSSSTSSTSSTSTSSTSTTSTSSTSTTSTSSTSTTSTSSTSTTSTTVNPNLCDGRTPTIVGTSGRDVINGTAGADVILGRGGDDDINGGGGNDVICGQGGADRINGGDGNDRILGGAGADQLLGDAGNDTLIGGAGAGFDQCVGGTGTDSATECEGVAQVP